MKKLGIVLLIFLFLAFGVSGASATDIDLYDWAFNLNSDVYYMEDSSTVPGLDDSSFDYVTGLGTLRFSYYPGTAGDYYLLSFFDHEIDQFDNTYYNETGASSGTPAAGQSWEIDEPGFYNGDIYVNFQANTLDKGIGTSVYGDTTFPDDVSMAMGWDFTLAALDVATIDFIVGESVPSGFYLSQTDPDSDATIYFSSNLKVEPIPEPCTMLLVGTGLAGLFGVGRKKFKK